MMTEKMLYNLLFLPILISFGLITSIDDFRESKIRNKWIAAGLIYSLVVYAIAWLMHAAMHAGIFRFSGNTLFQLTSHFDKWTINLLISAIVGYLIWWLKLWGAGDAKAFIVYVALIPIGKYAYGLFDNYFASFSLLLAIFIPATVVTLCGAILFYFKKIFVLAGQNKLLIELRSGLARIHLGHLVRSLLGFFAFIFLFRIIFLFGQFIFSNTVVHEYSGVFVFIGALLYSGFRNYFAKVFGYLTLLSFAFVVFALLNKLLAPGMLIHFLLSSVSSFSIVLLAVPFVNFIMDRYSKNAFQSNVPFAHWLFLGSLIIWFF